MVVHAALLHCITYIAKPIAQDVHLQFPAVDLLVGIRLRPERSTRAIWENCQQILLQGRAAFAPLLHDSAIERTSINVVISMGRGEVSCDDPVSFEVY